MTDLTLQDLDADETIEQASPSLAGRKIMIYGMNYAPEMAGVGKYTGDIAVHFAESGAEVEVVTTPPHYPGWRVQDGYVNRYRTTQEGSITVHRAPLLLRSKMSGVWRLLAPLSFAVTSAPVVFWKILTRRPQTVFCVEPTLLAAPVALFAAWLVGARTVLHVQDLEVDAAFAMGHLKHSTLLRRFGQAFERFVLKRFRHVVTISAKMAEKLVEKGCDPKRISLIRNWVDLDHIFPLSGESVYRKELNFSDRDFVVLYSGNIGAKQGLDILLEAAKHLQERENLKFVIAGEGPVKSDLMAKYADLPNVRFLPFQPHQRLNEFLNCADLHALMQEKGAADLVLPSKLGGMLASGKRIVVTADSGTELHDFLGEAAVFVETGNVGALADAILALQQGSVPHYPEKSRTLAFALAKDAALAQLVRLQANISGAQEVLQ
jgi:colanic acid biosynthesis glycosyl transferase WcaI